MFKKKRLFKVPKKIRMKDISIISTAFNFNKSIKKSDFSFKMILQG